MGGLFSRPSAGPTAAGVAPDEEAAREGSAEVMDLTIGAPARPAARAMADVGPSFPRV